MKTLTAKQIEKACLKYPYIIFRAYDNSVMAFNYSAMNCAKRVSKYKPKNRTRFISFKPCSFNEYISKKAPFLK